MQHLKTTIHKENLKKLKSGSKQQTIAQSLACSSVTDEQEFYFDYVIRWYLLIYL
jgi:hypothetical protein